jgi:hypothetical protein
LPVAHEAGRRQGWLTGTADTEAYEFQEIYGLETVVIPPNKPTIRKEDNDLIYNPVTVAACAEMLAPRTAAASRHFFIENPQPRWNGSHNLRQEPNRIDNCQAEESFVN